MRFSKQPKPVWVEGVVNQHADHVRIRYGEASRPIALIGKTKKGFTVQFLLKAQENDLRVSRILNEIRRELIFYLHDVVGPDSWPYVQYHCGSPANLRSIVHWSWHPSLPGHPPRTDRHRSGQHSGASREHPSYAARASKSLTYRSVSSPHTS
jgi:hypothetical protein